MSEIDSMYDHFRKVSARECLVPHIAGQIDGYREIWAACVDPASRGRWLKEIARSAVEHDRLQRGDAFTFHQVHLPATNY